MADELGFEAVWVGEHNARVYGIVASCPVVLAAIATQTERIKLGSAVTRLPLTHPLRAAEDFALVDQISNGRVHLGIGKELFPKTYQDPHPPIFVMISKSDSSVEWAASKGYSFILGQLSDWDDVKQKIERYRRLARDAGFSYDYIDATIQRAQQLKIMNVADSTQQAIDEYERGMMWYLDILADRGMFGFDIKPQPYEWYVEHRSVLLGSPEKLIEDLRDYRRYTGMGGPLGWFDAGGQPQDQVLRAVRKFSDEVVPEIS